MIQKISLILWTVLATWMLTACGTSSPVVPAGIEVPETKPPPIVNSPAPTARIGDLTVDAYACRRSGPVNGAEQVFATLVLRNKSNKNVTSLKVQVTFKNTLGKEITQTFDYLKNLLPDAVNFKGPNLVEAKLNWPTGSVLKSCQAKLESVVYAN
jgi:hypothetical protein